MTAVVIKGQFPSAWGLFEGIIILEYIRGYIIYTRRLEKGGLSENGFMTGMFINTGGVYQRRSHLREVVKGGIYIVLLEKLW